MARRNWLFGLGCALLSALAGCTLEEPFYGEFCPSEDKRAEGEYLSYILINGNQCRQAMCRSKEDCCGLSGEMAIQAFNTFTYARCAKNSEFDKCYYDWASKEHFCGPSFGTRVCDKDWHPNVEGTDCVMDSVHNCGMEGNSCFTDGVENAKCIDGACVAETCGLKYHLKDGACILDTQNACGETEEDCTLNPVKKLCRRGECAESCPNDESCRGVCVDFTVNHIESCEDDEYLVCQAGWVDINGEPGDGCEFDLSDVHVESFDAENEQILACTEGYLDCDGIIQKDDSGHIIQFNGCEIEIFKDHVDSCDAETGMVCTDGFADCNSDISDGCEIDLNTNNANCGACSTEDTYDENGELLEPGEIYACNKGFMCQDMECVPQCIAGQDYCDGNCINLAENNIASCHKDETGDYQLICMVGFENCDSKSENGCEVNLNTDRNNCGACAQENDFEHICGSGLVCSDGECTTSCKAGMTNCGGTCLDSGATHVESCEETSEKLSCMPGYKDCDGKVGNGCEINIYQNPAHCGDCSAGEDLHVCEMGQFCTNGNCTVSCAAGMENCAGICLDLLANHAESCDGKRLICKPGYMDCDKNVANGCEINIYTDYTNCGGCTSSDASYICPGGQFCTNTGCAATCGDGFTNCGGKCISITDNHVASCSENSIVLTCVDGYANCDSRIENGCEININTDGLNCGGCTTSTADNKCAPGTICSNGECKNTCAVGTKPCGSICLDYGANNVDSCDSFGHVSCVAGYGDCDGDKANGCEVNLNTDYQNCGGCSSSVASKACDAGEMCSAGKCSTNCADGLTTCGSFCLNLADTHVESCDWMTGALICKSGFADCDTKISNGCEVNINSDYMNCGGCALTDESFKCESGQLCSSGTCSASCGTGLSNCGGVCLNLADTNVERCSEETGELTCKNGFANCDNKIGNGCEVNISNDGMNCGGCTKDIEDHKCTSGKVCSSGHCDLTCGDGMDNCGGVCLSLPDTNVSSCDTSGRLNCVQGYANCDGVIANGCEVNINSDSLNCNGCNKADDNHRCESGQVCSDGECTANCGSGMTNCGGVCLKLAEINADSCDEITGVFSCKTNFMDCDGKKANGCETNVKTDIYNCGQCSTVVSDYSCKDGKLCTNGVCSLACGSDLSKCGSICLNLADTNVESCDLNSGKLTCKPGFKDCDGKPANGCEINVNSDNLNCRDCTTTESNHRCEAGKFCVNGSCETSCGSGLSNCGGTCLNLSEINASSCDRNTGELTCVSDFANCDGKLSNGCEVNIKTDSMNCSGCTTGSASFKCDNGKFCSNGVCGVNCVDGMNNCGGTCVDLAANHAEACSGTTLVCMNGYADCDGKVANGCEINISSDINNCGGCTTSERNFRCESGKFCSNRTCETTCGGGTTKCGTACLKLDDINATSCNPDTGVLTCVNNYADCDGKLANGCEVNLLNSNAHCGQCSRTGNDHSCDAAQMCNGGKCETSCSDGLTPCKGICLDLPANHVESCSESGIVCQSGFADCDKIISNGCEVDTRSDIQNCGACSTTVDPHACLDGSVCANSKCETSCSSGTKACQGICLDFGLNHVASCDGGTIVCQGGYENCDGKVANGCEINKQSDTMNCGGCTTPDRSYKCDDGMLCSSGACTLNCGTGTDRCGGICLNLAANHVMSCSSTGLDCAPGYADCDKILANGCEVYTQTDINNCGSCTTSTSNHVCDAGSICAMGSCSSSCAGDTESCGGICLDFALNHVESCVGGIKCERNYADCDGNVANGCEVNIQTDLNHCGGCSTGAVSHACDYLHGEYCSGGECGRSCATGTTLCGTTCVNLAANHATRCNETTGALTCVPGYADCDHNPANGCEVSIKSDSLNCGACTTSTESHRCGAGKSCENGTCSTSCMSPTQVCGEICLEFSVNHVASCSGSAVTCVSGYANCDGKASNGCEVNLKTDRQNCNVCGHACGAGSVCEDGHCNTNCVPGMEDCGGTCLALEANHVESCSGTTLVCMTGYEDCDKNTANGCEINTYLDDDHCGSCSNRCGAGMRCTDGACSLSCSTGLTECSGVCVNPNSDPANCGGCGSNCNTQPNYTKGYCEVGTCRALGCVSNYHLYDYACVLNTDTLCGVNRINCKTLPNATSSNCNIETGVCTVVCDGDRYEVNSTNTGCVVKSCGEGNTNCGTSTAPDCVNVLISRDNCGYCGYQCSSLDGWANGECRSGKCEASACRTNYCLNSTTKECVDGRNSTKLCGINGYACVDCSVSIEKGVGYCDNGTCKPLSCKPDYHINEDGTKCDEDSDTICGGGRLNCTTLWSNANKSKCVDGNCVIGCSDGYTISSDGKTCLMIVEECEEDKPTRCDTGCVNTTNDVNNCRGCGIKCSTFAPINAEADICRDSKCQYKCKSGKANAGTDFTADKINCVPVHSDACCSANSSGFCVDCTASGKICGSSYTCVNPPMTPTSCYAAGRAWCDGECVDVSNTLAHCGSCSNNCANLSGWSDGVCSDGVCKASACKGAGICRDDKNNTCVNGSYNARKCGTNGNKCEICADITNGFGYCDAGECKNACYTGYVYGEGVCTLATSICPASQYLCGGACVDRMTNKQHCGTCNHACGNDPNGHGTGYCNNGTCAIACAAGYQLSGSQCVPVGPACTGTHMECEGTCVDYYTDPDNCGDCGTKCDGVEGGVGYCDNKVCKVACLEGFQAIGDGSSCSPVTSEECPEEAIPTRCGGECVNITDNPDHCGGCFNKCEDNAPIYSHADECKEGECRFMCDDEHGNIGVDFTARTIHCIELNTAACCTKDENGRCIGCGEGQICNGGTCEESGCPGENQVACDGICVDIKTSKAHCGGCGKPCEDVENGTGYCNDGKCEVACHTGFQLIGTSCVEVATVLPCASPLESCGTECVNKNTDPAHCGSCSNNCGTVTNGTRYCSGGTCKTACNANYHLEGSSCVSNSACPDDLTNCDGTCVDLQTNKEHCGNCEESCADDPSGHGVGYCNKGECSIACVHPYVLSEDGKSCVDAISACEDPKPDYCGGECVDTKKELSHCGGCNHDCTKLTGWVTGVCKEGVCIATKCDGSGICLNKTENACVNGSYDSIQCGTDGNVCENCRTKYNDSTRMGYCDAGVCKFLCKPGYVMNATGTACVSAASICSSPLQLCSGSCVDLNTNPGHCGRCGNECKGAENGTPYCDRGMCKIACDTGFYLVGDTCTEAASFSYMHSTLLYDEKEPIPEVPYCKTSEICEGIGEKLEYCINEDEHYGTYSFLIDSNVVPDNALAEIQISNGKVIGLHDVMFHPLEATWSDLGTFNKDIIENQMNDYVDLCKKIGVEEYGDDSVELKPSACIPQPVVCVKGMMNKYYIFTVLHNENDNIVYWRSFEM